MINLLVTLAISVALPPDPVTGFAQAIVVPADSALIHTTQVFSEATGDIFTQTSAALNRLAPMTGGLDRIVRLHGIVDPKVDEHQLLEALKKNFPEPRRRPALTLVRSPLERPGTLVAFDAVAISTGGGQAALLPPGGRIDIAGQAEKADGTLAGCTKATLESLEKTLKGLGSDRSRIVQLKAFFKPMSDAATVRRIVREYFSGQEIPLVLVEWDMGLPIEIELVAATGPGTPVGMRFVTPPGMTSSPVFSRTAVTQGQFETIYTAGLTAPEGTTQNEQAKPIFAQLKSILDSTGSDMKHLSKATYYVSNPDANKSLDTIRPTLYDPKRPPSASKAGVSGVMPGTGRGMLVDMIAIRIFK